MAKPTLLVRGSLKTPPDVTDSPIEYVVAWLKQRMPEFGGHRALMSDRVLIIQSETGSGKSTVLPVYVFRILRSESTRGKYTGQSVLCTQPRVLTALDLARRQVSGTREHPGHYPDMVLGQTVGFQTGPFTEKPPAGLVFATIGILAAQLRTMGDDDIMNRYRFIIIDEAHERSREADATLLRLKNFYTRNLGNSRLPFLILASATIELAKYAAFFGVSVENTIHVEGRSYPITDHWAEQGTNNYPADAAEKAIQLHEAGADDLADKCDILIFVPGDAEIRAVRERLEQKNAEYIRAQRDGETKSPNPYLILAINREAIIEESQEFKLVSADVKSLPTAGRDKLPMRRIIISTVVAETGLTISTLRYVIDTGWSRMKELYPPYDIGGLVTRPAPQSRIRQRRGRVGRLFPGEFHPMYTENVYASLEPQQLPDIATGGMSDIILDIIGEQQRQKIRLGTQHAPEFRVEDIELLGTPPVEQLISALGSARILGFISPDEQLASGGILRGYGLTQFGVTASRLSRCGLEAARAIFAAAVWGVSTLDMITIAAMVDSPLESLMDSEFVRATAGSTIKARAALKDSMPAFMGRRGGAAGPAIPPTEEEAFFYRARLLIADDAIEGLLVFDEFQRRLERAEGTLSPVIEWLESVGIRYEKLIAVAIKRDELIEDLIAAGFNPLAAGFNPLATGFNPLEPVTEDLRLSKSTAESFLSRIIGIKRCLYDGYRLRLLRLDEKENAYFDRLGLRVEVPPTFSDNELRKLRAISDTPPVKPQFVIAPLIELTGLPPGQSGAKPLLYMTRARAISVMDGFVDIDLGFVRPQRCVAATAPESKVEGARQGTLNKSSNELLLNAYLEICAVALPLSPVCDPQLLPFLLRKGRFEESFKMTFGPKCAHA